MLSKENLDLDMSETFEALHEKLDADSPHPACSPSRFYIPVTCKT